MSLDLHKLASLLVRDYSIIAKRHHDMARDCRAIADTWRQVLDDTALNVLKKHSTQEDGMAAAPPTPQEESAYQSSFEELDDVVLS